MQPAVWRWQCAIWAMTFLCGVTKGACSFCETRWFCSWRGIELCDVHFNVLVKVSELFSNCNQTTWTQFLSVPANIITQSSHVLFWNSCCFSIQNIMRYHGAKGNLSTSSAAVEIEDKFDVLIDANDQILERVVSRQRDYSCQQTDEALNISRGSWNANTNANVLQKWKRTHLMFSRETSWTTLQE